MRNRPYSKIPNGLRHCYGEANSATCSLRELLDNFPDITASLSRFAASEELKH
jgi:hypothetical protein